MFLLKLPGIIFFLLKTYVAKTSLSPVTNAYPQLMQRLHCTYSTLLPVFFIRMFVLYDGMVGFNDGPNIGSQ